MKLFYTSDAVWLAEWAASVLFEYDALVSLYGADEKFTGQYLRHISAKEPILLADHHGLWLAVNGLKMQPKWQTLQQRVVRAGRKSELLLRALKLSPGACIIDGTAGLGHDAIIVAGRGVHVTMIESNPYLALLICDAMRQIESLSNWQSLHARLRLIYGDTTDYLSQPDISADAVSLDPMFPEDKSANAAVNGAMQVIHALVPLPTFLAEQQLLKASLACARKVVVKRSLHAPFLANQHPDHQWLGASIRYDGYFC